MTAHRIDYVKLGTRASAILACAMTILLVVPFAPFIGGLEGEPWRYAMNAAVSDHLVFGRDIVFTAGPLSTIYTRAYHPATDAFLLGGSLVLAFALCAGFLANTPARRQPWLLLVPFVISQLPFEGAMITALPLLLLLTAERYAANGGRKLLAVAGLLCVACTLLPLIKGTFAIAALTGIGLAISAMVRRRPTAAALLAGIGVVTLVGTWLLTDQPLRALPEMFLSQLPVISGYTVAMAIDGNTWEAFVYPLFAAGVLLGFVGFRPLRRWRVALAVAILLFIAFKAGFVRHDTHPIISACALALAGLIAFLETPGVTRKGVLALVAGFAGAVVTTKAYHSYDADQMQLSMFVALRESADGLARRIADPASLPAAFTAENARLRERYPLPTYAGTADIYPENVSALLASGATWKPRPAVLSYNAYTPSLAQLDEHHLRVDAPSRLYFSIGPIDGRYPSLEDGLSWPAMLEDYRVGGFAGPYLILDHKEHDKAVHFGAPRSITAVFGETVKLGDRSDPVWAKIDIQPTWLGSLANIVYKMPPIVVTLRYPDGGMRAYRIIPGMASAGFLLSPTVSNATEFLALQSRRREALLGKNFPIDLTISGGRGARWLWKADYKLTMSDLEIPVAPDVDALLLAAPQAADTETFETGGECAIDSVNDQPGLAGNIHASHGMISVRGWALASPSEGRIADTVSIALIQEGRTYLVKTRVVQRPDVGAHFQHPEAAGSGFEAVIDAGDLHGAYRVQVIQDVGAKRLACHATSAITVD